MRTPCSRIGSKHIPHSTSSFSSVVGGATIVVEVVELLSNLSSLFLVVLVGNAHSFDREIGPFVRRRFAWGSMVLRIWLTTSETERRLASSPLMLLTWPSPVACFLACRKLRRTRQNSRRFLIFYSSYIPSDKLLVLLFPAQAFGHSLRNSQWCCLCISRGGGVSFIQFHGQVFRTFRYLFAKTRRHIHKPAIEAHILCTCTIDSLGRSLLGLGAGKETVASGNPGFYIPPSWSCCMY